MKPESGVSRIMLLGVSIGLLFMLAGVLLSLFGRYDEHVTMANILSNGAGMMYLGTFSMIGTPIAVLMYLAVYYIFAKPIKYGIYCIMMLIFLLIIILMRI